MNVGLAYDLQTNPHDPRQAEFDPPRVLDAVCLALEQLGHRVERLGNAQTLLEHPECLTGIKLVLNLAEGSWSRNREAWIPILLDLWKVPYVGSDALALSVGLDKHLTKSLALGSGVPTPAWVTVNHPDEIPPRLPFDFPVIVKPRYEGSGIGIDPGAVVRSHQALRHRAGWLFAAWPQAQIIEAFVPDGELTVFMIGNEPPEIFPAIQRPLDPASRLSCHVVPSARSAPEVPLLLDARLDQAARQMALTMFQALGCRDLARVDLRVDAAGQPWFLEINPLPTFDPEGTMGLLAEYLGLRYIDMMGRVVDAALRRLASGRATSSRIL